MNNKSEKHISKKCKKEQEKEKEKKKPTQK